MRNIHRGWCRRIVTMSENHPILRNLKISVHHASNWSRVVELGRLDEELVARFTQKAEPHFRRKKPKKVTFKLPVETDH